MMEYLIHTALLLGGCFLYYTILLRKETHFGLNRWVLLGCLLGSLLLPLLTVPAGWSLRQALNSEKTVTSPTEYPVTSTTINSPRLAPAIVVKPELELADAGVVELTETTTSVASEHEVTSSSSAGNSVDWYRVFWWLYLAGVAVFGVQFLAQLSYLLVKMIRHPGFDAGDFRLVELREDVAPYSFWNRVFLNPDAYDAETYHQILLHEQVHVRQRHTIDLLLAELLIIIQWFNPFAWLYRRAIENNLEFLTDAAVLHRGENPVAYQLSLLKVAAPNAPIGMTTSYNQSLLEKRIAMMKTKKSSLASGWKYLFLFPLLLLSVLQFNAVAQVPAPPAPTPPATPAAPPPAPAPVEAPVAAPAFPSPAPVPPTAPAAAPTHSAPMVATPMPMPMPMPMTNPVTVNAMALTPTVSLAAVPMPSFTPAIEPIVTFSNAALADARRSWTAEITGEEICFTFIVTDDRRQHLSTNSRCFPKGALGTLPTSQMGKFSLQRAVGTVEFNGLFNGNEGLGNFTFTPDPAFVKMLAEAGYAYEDLELLHFFFIDFTPEYLAYLRQQGFAPTERELFKLAIFDLDERAFKQAQADYQKAGFGKPGLKEMIELRIHGVSGAYINELGKAGYANLTLEQVKAAKIHGLSATFITDMAQAGFRNLAFDDVINMSIHGVNSAYVKELAGLGYQGLDAKEVVNARIHGVSTQGLADLKKAGFTNLSLPEASTARIHGVDAAYVRELNDLGYAPLSIDEVVQAKIHGVSKRKIGDLKKAGLANLTLQEAREAAIHGVNAVQVEELSALGYTDLTFRDFVDARIHGITPAFVRSYATVGFGKIAFSDLLKLKIHNVTPDFIKQHRRDGDSLEDLIDYRIRRGGRR